MNFTELLAKVCQNQGKQPFQGKLLALDPGETIGWAVFEKGELTNWGQLKCEAPAQFRDVEDLIDQHKPEFIVCEAYRIYSWKRDQHVWSDLLTVRLIGAIELLCIQREISFETQMAAIGKGFCTDSKLKTWGYWKPSQRHARDAIRHGCYWLLFSKLSKLISKEDPNA